MPKYRNFSATIDKSMADVIYLKRCWILNWVAALALVVAGVAHDCGEISMGAISLGSKGCAARFAKKSPGLVWAPGHQPNIYNIVSRNLKPQKHGIKPENRGKDSLFP